MNTSRYRRLFEYNDWANRRVWELHFLCLGKSAIMKMTRPVVGMCAMRFRPR